MLEILSSTMFQELDPETIVLNVLSIFALVLHFNLAPSVQPVSPGGTMTRHSHPVWWKILRHFP